MAFRKAATASSPIRAYSRKGFVIGWLAIVIVGATSFAGVSMALAHGNSPIAISTE